MENIDGEHARILTSLGISQEEIDEANITRNYERIARKLQVIFVQSLIENSSKSVIRMDPKVSILMNELRNANNREIINLEVLKEDEEIYPDAIRQLMNHYADLILDNFFSIEDLRNVSTNMVVANSFMRKFKGTPDEGFASYILGTTSEIYDFNQRMIGEVSENPSAISDERKMALEFGAEYLSTLGDYEFLNLLSAQKIITEEQKKSLTRTYRAIGREGLIQESVMPGDWKAVSQAQVDSTESFKERVHQEK